MYKRVAYNSVKTKSKILLFKFIKASASYLKRYKKVRKVIAQVNKIPRLMKNFLWKKATYRCLIEGIWDRYFLIMYTKVLKEKYIELSKVALIPISEEKATFRDLF